MIEKPRSAVLKRLNIYKKKQLFNTLRMALAIAIRCLWPPN